MACSYLAGLVRHRGEAVLKQLRAVALFHEAFTEEPADELHEQLGVRHQGRDELLHKSYQPAPCNVKGYLNICVSISVSIRVSIYSSDHVNRCAKYYYCYL
jgi:hypothetical protein